MPCYSLTEKNEDGNFRIHYWYCRQSHYLDITTAVSYRRFERSSMSCLVAGPQMAQCMCPSQIRYQKSGVNCLKIKIGWVSNIWNPNVLGPKGTCINDVPHFWGFSLYIKFLIQLKKIEKKNFLTKPIFMICLFHRNGKRLMPADGARICT